MIIMLTNRQTEPIAIPLVHMHGGMKKGDTVVWGGHLVKHFKVHNIKFKLPCWSQFTTIGNLHVVSYYYSSGGVVCF